MKNKKRKKSRYLSFIKKDINLKDCEYISYIEQDESLKDSVIITITREEAIKRQKASANYLRRGEYLNDEDALDDFIVIHWAWGLKVKND